MEVSSSIVVIGPSGAIPGLRERLDSGAELHTFTDAQVLEALDHILRHKPRIIVLDHEFSVTSRGAAFIARVKDDPQLGECEVRVAAHDSGVHRVAIKRGGSSTRIAVADPKAAVVDGYGTRRAARIPIRDGVQVLIDGNPAALLTLSTLGVQVLSANVLKPNQRVRMAFSDTAGIIRCQGSVVWASFEMPKGEPPRYRAGIELSGANADAISRFAMRHQKKPDAGS